MKGVWVLLAALVLATCATCVPHRVEVTHVQEPVRVFDAKPLVPEGWWENIYNLLVKCTDAENPPPYDEIEWFVVEAEVMKTPDGRITGLWSPPNRIYIDAQFVMQGATIRHELLHYIAHEIHDDPESRWDELAERCL